MFANIILISILKLSDYATLLPKQMKRKGKCRTRRLITRIANEICAVSSDEIFLSFYREIES